MQINAGRQYNLFDLQKYDRLEIINRTVDNIWEKYGEYAVFRSGFLDSSVPHMNGGLDKKCRSGVTIGIDVKHVEYRSKLLYSPL